MTDFPALDRIPLAGTVAELRPVFDPRLRTYSVQLWENGQPAGIHGLAEDFRFAGGPLESIDAFLSDHDVRPITAEESALLYAGLVRAEGGTAWQALRMTITAQQPDHRDQDEQPAPESEPTVEGTPDLLLAADLHGRFRDGYSADDIRDVFGAIHAAGGPYLVCVWDYADEYGFGGNSEFYAEDPNGHLLEVQPDIYRWLSGQQDTPGRMSTWVCAPSTEPAEFPVTDDSHNYARADKTDD
jgi:hypothetical protein